MALTPEEQKILEYGKANGKSAAEVKAAISRFRSSSSTPTAQPTQSAPVPEKKGFVDTVLGAGKAASNFLGLDKATNVFGNALARTKIGAAITGTDVNANREYIEAPTAGQLAGATLQTGALVAGTALTGGTGLAGQVAAGAGLGYLYDVGSDLVEQESLGEVLDPDIGTVVGAAAPVAVRGASALLGAGSRLASGATSKVSGVVADVAPGVGQVASDLVERVPRAINRGKTFLDEAGEKAAKLKTATPAAQTAIKVGLDDQLVTGIRQADDATKTAFREMVDIAETPAVGLRKKTPPSVVAGETASKQYDLVETQRKAVGARIGELSDALSNKTQVDVLPLQRSVRDVLRQNGILPDKSGTLKFQTKRLTPQQQSVVQRLYELATVDEKLTPRQVHEFDQLFSKLQREARFRDQVDDIYLNVQTAKGPAEVNIFKVFRDIYSQQLDQLSSQMRQLNQEYRLLRNLQDDLDNTIFKSGNYESAGSIDGAEFAKTNLRRIFSDAQSAPTYEGIYNKLDSVSRGLGYTGARADELALFAEKLRSIYPDTVPETSFRGGISGALETVMELGKPDTKDKQEALKKLLEELAEPTT